MSWFDRARQWLQGLTTLQMALLFSAAVHVSVLLYKFPEISAAANDLFKEQALEVILVNAQSNTKPDKAQAIAQYNLEGGGDADKGRATTPLPLSENSTEGEAFDEAAKQINQLQDRQNQLLTQVKQALSDLPPPELLMQNQSDPATRAELERRKALLQMYGEIERRINAENARPKKRYLSPSTKASSQAIYYDRFRRKVERAGTLNFPTVNGQRLYGELIMLTTIDTQGKVNKTEVVKSSGNHVLDQRARAIVRSAAPYGVAPKDMQQPNTLWVLVSRFKFTKDDGFEAKMSTNPDDQM